MRINHSILLSMLTRYHARILSIESKKAKRPESLAGELAEFMREQKHLAEAHPKKTCEMKYRAQWPLHHHDGFTISIRGFLKGKDTRRPGNRNSDLRFHGGRGVVEQGHHRILHRRTAGNLARHMEPRHPRALLRQPWPAVAVGQPWPAHGVLADQSKRGRKGGADGGVNGTSGARDR